MPLNLSLNTKVVQNILASIAAVFGLVTIVAGTRVLLGADPGYIVFQPLLIYNTAMGVAYIGAGLLAWRNARQGQFAAAAIFLLNGLVLAAIAYLYVSQGPVAVDSLRAMILRTGVWSVLFLGLVWVARRSRRKDAPV
jgi:hypothetical protein